MTNRMGRVISTQLRWALPTLHAWATEHHYCGRTAATTS